MIKRALKYEYVKNILTLISGNSIATLLPLLAEPVLTRLFPPEDFGLLAIFISISTMFAVVATLRYELAIVLPKDKESAINLLGVSFITSIIIAMVSFGIVGIFSERIAHLLKTPEITQYLLFVPVLVLFFGWHQTFSNWFLRTKSFKTISAARITQSGTNAAASIGAGFAKMGVSGLVISQILGQVFSAIVVMGRFIGRDWNALKLIQLQKMKAVAKEYDEFPKVNTFYILADTIKYQSIILLLAPLFDQVVTGLYSRTFRILVAPLTLIGTAISQVFYQKAANIHQNNGNLRRFTFMTMLGLAGIATPIFTVVLLFGPQIFAFVLGDAWYDAGVYAQYLTPWIFAIFVYNPLSQIPLILKRQPTLFILSIIGIVLLFASLIIGAVVYNDVLIAFGLVSGTQFLFYVFITSWIIKITPGSIRNSAIYYDEVDGDETI